MNYPASKVCKWNDFEFSFLVSLINASSSDFAKSLHAPAPTSILIWWEQASICGFYVLYIPWTLMRFFVQSNMLSHSNNDQRSKTVCNTDQSLRFVRSVLYIKCWRQTTLKNPSNRMLMRSVRRFHLSRSLLG